MLNKFVVVVARLFLPAPFLFLNQYIVCLKKLVIMVRKPLINRNVYRRTENEILERTQDMLVL